VNYRRRRIPLSIIGISIPAVLHGLNDWAASLSNQGCGLPSARSR